MNAVEINELKKSFGGVKAVNGISFHVEEGETLGIIGPNGAGKTTVFNLATGFYTPDSGKIMFFGKDISRLPSYKLPGLGMGRTFQNLRLFQNLTVMENITSAILCEHGYNIFSGIFRTERYRLAEAKVKRQAQHLIDFFRLTGREKTLPMAFLTASRESWSSQGPSPWDQSCSSSMSPVRV